MIQMLLGQPLEQADLSSLIAISSGASPLPGEVRREFEARVPSAKVYEGYGCTESATLISANPIDARRAGSVGLPVPGCEVSIRDDADRALPAGQDGEICVRSPGVMTGYWHTADSASTVLAGGWLHTGDIGHRDSEGYYFIVDRKKELVIRGGFNVYPREIEEVLYQHPAVLEAAVFGVADATMGEEVNAAVALRPGQACVEGELIAFVKERVAAYKYPRRVFVLETLPKGPTGKILKLELKAQLVPAEA
jgi:long-chain acyl-CoA synthetase